MVNTSAFQKQNTKLLVAQHDKIWNSELSTFNVDEIGIMLLENKISLVVFIGQK